jgi:hypothetical protein
MGEMVGSNSNTVGKETTDSDRLKNSEISRAFQGWNFDN